ncbi:MULTISPECIES: YwmB family TATA-box binding protein [Paenibacillus]|uniref:YwmB family TATA-box binding protein n=1 Tax=Paenibacillus TaxID=44249 RepID=UPI0022B92E70|nr:YwmB family TATA-box binding protein [Paenibacillus caseinilyticus]MCZ8523306.1 YwmB family TATA-box binding protein [Paenibacillus caseinilyticus]
MKRTASFFLLLTVTLLCLWGALASGAGANRDLERLLPLSSEVIDGPVRVVVKHISPYKPHAGEEAFLATGRQLSERFGLPPAELRSGGDHILYKASGPDSGGIRRTLLWVLFPDGSTELIVSAETPESAAGGEDTASRIEEAQTKLSRVLEGMGVKPHWNVILQGKLKESYASAEKVNVWLREQLEAQEVERYDDGASVSVSYASPLIEASVQSGGRRLNLQAAVHRSSETGERRLTLGTPVITTEY